MRRLTIVPLALGLIIAHGCDGEAGGPAPGVDATAGDVATDAGPPPGPATSFTTFNAGIARNYVGYAAERLPHVVAALAEHDADVVCLQEVWRDGDVATVLAGTAGLYPYSHTAETLEADDAGANVPACDSVKAAPLPPCLQANCADSQELAFCALEFCAAEIGDVSDACFLCMAANINDPVDQIFDTCTTRTSTMLDGGRNGLVLLSKVPLQAPAHTVLSAFFIRRVALHAQVETPAGPTEVACTHLSAALATMPYQGDSDSWKAEQRLQIEEIEAAIAARAGADGAAVFMGDLNTGPELPPDIAGKLPTNWARLPAAGWLSPYLDLAAPKCTHCTSNPLVGEASSTKLIDHVLFRGFGAHLDGATAARVLDEAITVEGVESRLSDHYGVRVALQPATGSSGP